MILHDGRLEAVAKNLAADFGDAFRINFLNIGNSATQHDDIGIENIDEIMPVHKSSWLIMLGLVPVPENIRRDCLSQDERDIEDAAASGNKKYSRKGKGRNAKRFSQNDVVAMMDRAAQIFLSGIEKRPVILGMLHKEGMIPEDDKGVLLSDHSVLIAISNATIATGKDRKSTRLNSSH